MEEKMHSSLYLTTLKKSIVLVNITSQTNKYNVQPWSILCLLQNQARFSEMYLHFITKNDLNVFQMEMIIVMTSGNKWFCSI